MMSLRAVSANERGMKRAASTKIASMPATAANQALDRLPTEHSSEPILDGISGAIMVTVVTCCRAKSLRPKMEPWSRLAPKHFLFNNMQQPPRPWKTDSI